MTQANIKSNNSLIPQLKAENQDFEFYPTTAAIARAVYNRIDKYSSVLDIGAGNGNFFRLIESFQKKANAGKDKHDSGYVCKLGDKYAIEKSKILIDNMDKDIALVGTDFTTQTLIDKNVNLIFSNPPYSQAVQWANKIIRESNCQKAFIVMPESKFANSGMIADALEARSAKANCIYNYDYRNSEFRKARTKVGVYEIDFCRQYKGYRDTTPAVDPFNMWFDENFKFSTMEDATDFAERLEEKKELVSGRNLIERLELMYQEDMQRIQQSYKAISQIPFELLKELNINQDSVKEALKMKLKNAKNLYWNELFKNLKVITDRLTHKSRRKLLDKLNSSTNVDFTSSNAYAVVCWALKNANHYFDEQLIDIYMNLSRSENVKAYKSNIKFISEDFRYYQREKYKNFKLDYRLILPGRGNSLTNWIGNPVGLDDYDNRSTVEGIQDIFTIAHNLGFEPNPLPMDNWEYGKNREIKMKNGEIFARIKIYKNGNFHYKLNVDFMKAFNIEAGRLLGWLKTPQQAATELELKPEECLKYFKSNISLDNSNIKLLAG